MGCGRASTQESIEGNRLAGVAGTESQRLGSFCRGSGRFLAIRGTAENLARRSFTFGRAPDKRWDPVRDTMGYIRRYAERMNLAAARPRADLTSTGHALANTIGAHAEYLVYAPYGGNFTVDLSANDREFTVEWFRAASGVTTAGPPVRGGAVRGFNPPFDGDAVLYLH